MTMLGMRVAIKQQSKIMVMIIMMTIIIISTILMIIQIQILIMMTIVTMIMIILTENCEMYIEKMRH